MNARHESPILHHSNWTPLEKVRKEERERPVPSDTSECFRLLLCMRNMKERTCSFFRLKHWNNARGAFTIDITQEHWNAAKHTEAKPNKHTLTHNGLSRCDRFSPCPFTIGRLTYAHTYHSAVLCVRQRSNKMESWPALPFKKPYCFHGDRWQTTAHALCHENVYSISHPYTHVNILFKGEVCNLSLIYRDTHSQIYLI